VKQKDVGLLLDALAQPGLEHFRLTVLGDGPERENLAAQRDALGLADRVLVAGPDPEARRWLSAFDLFCFPSTDEGLPNAVMEAAMAGVAVVGWRTDFFEELLGEGAAALVETGDAPALQRTLAALIEDPQERARLGREGRTRMLAKFGVSRFVQSLTAVYGELLSLNGVNKS